MYKANAFSILTKHLPHTVDITFAVWGEIAKLAWGFFFNKQRTFSFSQKRSVLWLLFGIILIANITSLCILWSLLSKIRVTWTQGLQHLDSPVHLLTYRAFNTKWLLCGKSWIKGIFGMLHVRSGDQAGARFHHATQNGM